MDNSTDNKSQPTDCEASQKGQVADDAPPPITYVVRNQFPPDPVSVKVVFRGLLNLFFDSNRSCRVGVFNDSPGTQPHSLEFRRWTKDEKGDCPAAPTVTYPTPVTKFELRVTGSIDSIDGVYVFGGTSFDRTATSGNEAQDYRWILDFEVDLYPKVLTKLPDELGPRLTINNGMFYTLRKTNTGFNGHFANGALPVKSLGNMADITAANIYLKPTGFVEVFIDDDPTPVDTLRPDREHQIDVYNLCRTCDFLPAHPSDKTERSDLYLYYEALNLDDTDDIEYEFLAIHPFQDGNAVDLCELDSHGTDPAPCGPSGYGRSSSG